MANNHARLAKRISATTTNCLLTAVVLVVGWSFGRQVLRWWAEDDTAESAETLLPAAIGDGLGDPWRLHIVQFGEQSWSLRRQSIAGGKQVAATALRASCGEVVRRQRLPQQQPGVAESEFLSRLAAQQPAEQEPGKWRLYELTEALPMVVGTQPRRAAGDASPREHLAVPAHRVVTWGLALPAGPEAWTLFTFQSEVPSGGQTAGMPKIPVPPECRRTLSMRVAGGGAILTFEGPEDPKTWAKFYDRWFATHNWKTAGGWRRFGSRWHVRYSAPGKVPAGCVDVHFGSDGRGGSTGLLVIGPSPAEQGG